MQVYADGQPTANGDLISVTIPGRESAYYRLHSIRIKSI